MVVGVNKSQLWQACLAELAQCVYYSYTIKKDEERGIEATAWAIKAAKGVGRTQYRPNSQNHHTEMLFLLFSLNF